MHFTLVHQWVEFVLLYFEGKVEIWYDIFLLGDNDLTNWEKSSKAICMRFDSLNDIVEEFNKMKWDRVVKKYVSGFEQLKLLMNTLNPSLL